MQPHAVSVAAATRTVTSPRHARHHRPHRAVDNAQRPGIQSPPTAIGRQMRRAHLYQFLHHVAQQLGIKNLLRLRKTRERHRLPTTMLLHPAKLARRAQRAHRAHHRIEDAPQKQPQVLAGSQTSQPVEFAPPRLDARPLQQLLEPSEHLPSAQIALGDLLCPALLPRLGGFHRPTFVASTPRIVQVTIW
jgi:hypothetical protein